MGAGRILVAGLAILALLGLIAFGAFALVKSLTPDDPAAGRPARTAAGATPSGARGTEPVPTITIECLAQVCPVFLRVPGGDVLVDRDLARGEHAAYYEPRIDVVLNDAAAVRVLVNGEERERGGKGERQTFTVARTSPRPTPG